MVHRVDFIKSAETTQKLLPDPQLTVADGLEDDARLFAFSLELSRPSYWVEFPLPMLAVDTSQETRKLAR